MSEAGKINILSQLFLNEELSKDNSRSLTERLSKAKKAGLQKLIIWSVRPEYLSSLVSICRGVGISPHLWYPMLADAPVDFDTDAFKIVRTLDDGRSEILESQKAGGEEFEFLCPNKVRQEEAFLSRFEKILGLADFDGVFLDRIRFPSPANGIGEMLTCFCDTCKEMSSATGSAFEEAVHGFVKKLGSKIGMDEVLETLKEFYRITGEFLEFRKSSVLQLLASYADRARNLGLEVGVDLFSPSLRNIVSQDYERISRHVDWMKPMVYCKTMGPAGLPMELLSLAKILVEHASRLSEREALEIIGELTGLLLPESFDEIRMKGIDQKNYELELNKIDQMNLNPVIRIFPGFEAVNLPPVCSVGLEEVRNYVDATLRKGHDGFVLSWDIRHISDAILEYVGDRFE
ncbi:hypothetical protein Theba_2253 [Mesotoga prima MesG1.Ag.4.2]|uniref:Glycosyl hydrolase-like 10 domain-containing protein n=1 Tax=Mesotoga prima MesG1.Ag.4.2 TaxID=660470 RepID=I2F7H9_9BACT|nr:hypothetical protein [Mesotoga prima]AFK07882.1 hypothetical protein Theba_2253 [Mesotoga prima MesG1.Ag.4.2]